MAKGPVFGPFRFLRGTALFGARQKPARAVGDRAFCP